MALEISILQILIDAEIKLVGQEQIIYFILELEQVSKRQGFAYQCDIHIGKGLLVPLTLEPKSIALLI